MKDNITSTVARNTLIQLVGKFVFLLTSFGIVKLLTNYLGQEGFGQYSFITIYLGFFTVAVDLGLYLLAINRINSHQGPKLEKELGNILTLRIISLILALTAAIILVIFLPGSSELKYATTIATLAFFATSLTQLWGGFYQGFYRAEYGALAETSTRIITFLLMLTAAFFDQGLIGMIMALIIGSITGTSIGWYFLKKFVIVKPRFDKKIQRQLLKEALPLGIVLSMSYLYMKQDSFLLGVLPNLPDGIDNNTAVGIYNAPFKLIDVIQTLPNLFLTTIFPFFVNQNNKEQPKNNSKPLLKIYQKSFDTLMTVMLPLAIGTTIMAPTIIHLMTDNTGWDDSILCLQILIWTIIFSAISNLSGHIITSKNQQNKLILPNITFFIINFLLNLYFIPIYSYYGAAIATIITEIIVIIINLKILYQTIHWYPNLKTTSLISMIVTIMAIQVITLKWLGLWYGLNILLAIFSYCLAIWFIPGALPKELKRLTLQKFFPSLLNKR